MQKIGKYQIVEEVGKGGMGVIFRAFDAILQREVALKTLSVDLSGDDESRKRFFREARLAGSLSHRNIVTIFELGEDNNQAFIAMELLQGEDLTSLKERLTLEESMRVVAEIGEGLAHAHRKGITHRDIKPSNVFITKTGRVKVLDFGLARFATSNLTATGQVLGTPHYMTPEQVQGKTADQRSDIFSLGSVFYELLTKQKAFTAETLQEILFNIVNRKPERVESVNPMIPPQICEIVHKALAKKPADRYQQIEEMLDDLASASRSVERQKKELQKALKKALAELGGLIEENEGILSREGVLSIASERLAGFRVQEDREPSYVPLVSLVDAAVLERNRIETVLQQMRERGESGSEDDLETMRLEASPRSPRSPQTETLTLEGGSHSRKVGTMYAEAATLLAKGDIPSSLTHIDELLRLEPNHPGANDLAEELRRRVISLADSHARQRRESLAAAALQILDQGTGQRKRAHKRPLKPAVVSELSRLFLSVEGSTKPKAKKQTRRSS